MTDAISALNTEHETAQKGHFYGHGDPDHKPSILQKITAQRYRGTFSAGLYFEDLVFL